MPSHSRNPSIASRRVSSARNPSVSSNPDWNFGTKLGQNDFDWGNVNLDDAAFSGYDGFDQEQSNDFLLGSLSYMEPERQLSAVKSRRASLQMMNRPLAAVPDLELTQSYDQSDDYSVDPSLLNSDFIQNSSYNYQSDANAPYYNDFSSQIQVFDGFDNGTAAKTYDDDLRSTSPSTRKRQRGDEPHQQRPRKRAREERRYQTTSSPDTRRSSGDSSSLSETSSLRRSRRSRTMITTSVYEPEKPQTDQNKHWIRINHITEGKTSRTGKINHYKAEDVYDHDLPNTIGDWHGSKTLFKYDRYGELHQRTYNTNEIKEFLYEHPRTNDCKLKLWIQKSPADSARRYPQEHSSKCRFKSCPVQTHFKGTILHGHYRVAFDEKWHKYRENADPFHVAAYVHLYCLERFLDFPDICRKLDIESDNRVLRNEPRNKFLASLGNSCEHGIASKFIEDCRYNRLDQDYPNYPIHSFYRHGKPKPHEHTLTYALTKGKTETRPPAQIRQFEERGLSESHILVHMGDLDKFVEARLKKKKVAKRRKRGEPSEDEASEAEIELPARTRAATISKRQQPAPRIAPRTLALAPRRRSPRNRERVSYAAMDAADSTNSGTEDGLFIPEVEEAVPHQRPRIEYHPTYDLRHQYNPNPNTNIAWTGPISPPHQHGQQPRKSSLAQHPRQQNRTRNVSFAPQLSYEPPPPLQPEQPMHWTQQQFLAAQPVATYDLQPQTQVQANGRKTSIDFANLIDSIQSYEYDPSFTGYDDTQLFADLTNDGYFAQSTSPQRRNSSPRTRRRSSAEQQRKVVTGERNGSVQGSPRRSERLRSRNSSLGSLFGGSP